MRYLLLILFLLVAFAGAILFPGRPRYSHLFVAQVVPNANEAVLFLSPQGGTYVQGSTIPVALKLSVSSPITSLRAYITYNPSLASVLSIQKTGSAFLTWWEETVDAQTGKIQLQASLPAPGFAGTNGLVATINLKVLQPGTLAIGYDQSSLALQADDTNILNLGRSETGSYILTSFQNPVPPSLPFSPVPDAPAVRISDCNSDSKFNVLDFAIMQTNWKKRTSSCEFTKDGVIDIFDLSVLMSNWTG